MIHSKTLRLLCLSLIGVTALSAGANAQTVSETSDAYIAPDVLTSLQQQGAEVVVSGNNIAITSANPISINGLISSPTGNITIASSAITITSGTGNATMQAASSGCGACASVSSSISSSSGTISLAQSINTLPTITLNPTGVNIPIANAPVPAAPTKPQGIAKLVPTAINQHCNATGAASELELGDCDY